MEKLQDHSQGKPVVKATKFVKNMYHKDMGGKKSHSTRAKTDDDE